MLVYVGSLMLAFLIIRRYTHNAGNLAHLEGCSGLKVAACLAALWDAAKCLTGDEADARSLHTHHL